MNISLTQFSLPRYAKNQAVVSMTESLAPSRIEKLTKTQQEFCFQSAQSITGMMHNPRQNICSKIEKSSKIGLGKKSLILTFACFLTDIAKASTHVFTQDPKILSLKSFATRQATRMYQIASFVLLVANQICTKTL